MYRKLVAENNSVTNLCLQLNEAESADIELSLHVRSEIHMEKKEKLLAVESMILIMYNNFFFILGIIH